MLLLVTYKEEFPKEDKLTAFNTNFNPNTGTKGALEYNDKIDFNKDCIRIEIRIECS
jgi:hypothetical protein